MRKSTPLVVPVLDRSRLRRWRRRIEWPVSRRVHLRFRELLHELVDLESGDQTDRELQQRMESLREDIRALPGFPVRYHPEKDLIVPITTTAQR